MIVCGELEISDVEKQAVTNPRVVIEVVQNQHKDMIEEINLVFID